MDKETEVAKTTTQSKGTTKAIKLTIKETYKDTLNVNIKRSGQRSTISMAEVKRNPVKAIYDYKLEYLFSNPAEDLTEIIRRVDEKKGLHKKPSYQTRKLQGVEVIEDVYNVI